jgi:hypothetical protein
VNDNAIEAVINEDEKIAEQRGEGPRVSQLAVCNTNEHIGKRV